MQVAKTLFWVFVAPYLFVLTVGFALGFACAMLIGPIRQRWLAMYDAQLDPPHVPIESLHRKSLTPRDE